MPKLFWRGLGRINNSVSINTGSIGFDKDSRMKYTLN